MPEKKDLIIVYTLKHCPQCVLLKEYLESNNIGYSEQDLSTAEALTELRVNGIFTHEAPVLQKETDFYITSDLFPEGRFDQEHIRLLLSGDQCQIKKLCN